MIRDIISSHHRRTGARIVFWLAPVIVLLLALRAVDTLPVGAMYDDAVYVVLGKALATGHGLRYLQLPGQPLAAHFPPGYPALLGLLWSLVPAFPANVLLFKAVNALLVAIMAAALAVFARERFQLSNTTAAVGALVASAGVPTLTLSALVMSESLFLALAVPALLAAERVVDGDRRARWLVVAGAAAGIATLVRTQGIALVGALAVVLLLRRRWRHALVCTGVAALVIAPWQLWVLLHAGALPAPLHGTYGPYTSWLVNSLRAGGVSFVAQTVYANMHNVASMLAYMAAPVAWPGVAATALALLLLLSALGAWRMWRRAPVTAVFLALYMGIVLVWPYAPARFVGGIWPLLLLLPLLGLHAIVLGTLPVRATRALRVALLVAVAIPAAGYARYTWTGYRQHWWNAIPQSRGVELRSAIETAKRATPGAVVSSMEDAAVYLYTGRQAVPFTSFEPSDFLRSRSVAENADLLAQILAAYRVDDVVVTTADERRTVQQLVQRTPPILVLRDSSAEGFLYSPVSR